MLPYFVTKDTFDLSTINFMETQIKSNEEKLLDFEKLVARVKKSKLPKLATMLFCGKTQIKMKFVMKNGQN